MNLDSVRDLKSSLLDNVLPGVLAAVRTRSLTREGMATPGLAEDQPTLALGVTPRAEGDFALAVRIQQRALQQSREVERIRQHARGEVDIRYVGVVRKQATPWYRQRLRPLRIGCSIGHFRITAGTLGAVVRRHGGGPLAILSNNHVLANENRGKKGDAILQPGRYDGGQEPEDTVAQLVRLQG